MARRFEEYQADLFSLINQMYFENYLAINRDYRYDVHYLRNSPSFLMTIKNLDEANSTYYTFSKNTADKLREFKDYLDQKY